MRPDPIESPRWVGIRQGLGLLVASVALSPMRFVVERLMPSRENTVLDELPALLLTVAMTGLAIAGLARVAHACLAERQYAQLMGPKPVANLDRPKQTGPCVGDPTTTTVTAAESTL